MVELNEAITQYKQDFFIKSGDNIHATLTQQATGTRVDLYCVGGKSDNKRTFTTEMEKPDVKDVFERVYKEITLDSKNDSYKK